MDNNLNIIICGGGTGGHLFPAFAIADSFLLTNSNVEIRFIGSEKGIESNLYKKRTEKSYLLKSVGLNRSLSLKAIFHNSIIFPLNFLRSMLKTFKIFKEFKVDVVIGTGGYSSAIPLFVAYIKGIKFFIQEQNSKPGLVNKIFINSATKVFFGVEPEENENINYLVLGNPTKSINNNIKKENKVSSENFTVFIIGGSQGSVPINNHFIKNYKKYLDLYPNIHMIWQCGENNLESIRKQVQSKRIELHGFINDIENYYLKSNLIISRSGALTLTEISNFKKPSILIPFPFAANDHQMSNAKLFEKKGASKIVNQKELVAGILEEEIDRLIKDKKKLKEMGKNASLISMPNAAQNIVEEILKHV
tara:strand:- start:10359 stop:11447 length:1089 start_codon:yes stop_codon:yes gene_type:complete